MADFDKLQLQRNRLIDKMAIFQAELARDFGEAINSRMYRLSNGTDAHIQLVKKKTKRPGATEAN